MKNINDKELKQMLYFDQYSRYAIIRDIINLNRVGSLKLKILDVGGIGNYLSKFLPNDDVFYLDPYLRSSDPNFIKGDGCNMTFDDECFDWVVSADTFEHIPLSKKKSFLKENIRVSKSGVVLAAPFYTKEIETIEKRVNQSFKRISKGKGHKWLEEHIKFGLPKEIMVEKFLEKANYNYQKISHNNLILWEILMNIELFCSVNYTKEIDPEIRRFNYFYNKYIYPFDFGRASYRKIYFIKKRRYLKDLNINTKELKPTILFNSINLGINALQSIYIEKVSQQEKIVRNRQILLQNKAMGILKLEKLIKHKDNLIDKKDEGMLKLEKLIKCKDNLIDEKDKKIIEMNTGYNEYKGFQNGLIWKGLMRYRKFKDSIKKILFYKSVFSLTRSKKFVVFLSHIDYLETTGGSQKYQLDEIKTLNNLSINVFGIYINVKNNRSFGLNLNTQNLDSSLAFKDIITIFKIFKLSKNLISFNIHHLLGYTEEQIKILIKLVSREYVIVYLHDIFFINYKRFIKINKYVTEIFGINVKNLINSDYSKLLDKVLSIASYIICPSKYLKNLFTDKNKGLNNKKITLVPHLKLDLYKKKLIFNHKKLRLAYLGYKSKEKGWHLFKKLTEDPCLTNLYKFYHIGSNKNERNNKMVEISYSYKENSQLVIQKLLEHEIDIVLLWSLLPESYSYTMYEAYSAGIPILTWKGSGNIAFQIINHNIYGKVFYTKAEIFNFLKDKINVKRFIKNNNKDFVSRIKHYSIFKLLYKKGNLK